MEKVVVWFDQLGLERLTLNKVAFTLFGKVEVRWYGIFITLGIVLAFLYAIWRGKQDEGIITDDILDVGICTVICGVVGARIYYVLTSLDEFPTFWSMFEIWNGGIGIYGAIIGGAFGIWLAGRIKKLNCLKLYDMIAPGVMIAQVIGRWGNFFNGEAYGYRIDPITHTSRYFFFTKEFTLPCGEGTLFHKLRMGLYPNIYSSGEMVFVHPTFLYESVWNLIGFILITALYRRKKFDGQVVLSYLTWYGFGRMFIEGLRTDSLYLLEGTISRDGLRISQLIGLLCFVIGLALLIYFYKTAKPKEPDFITVRELPVRRAMADGTVIVEEPTAVEAAESDTTEESNETPDTAAGDEKEDTDGTDH